MDELTAEQIEALKQNLVALKAELEADLQARSAEAGPVELDQARVGRLSRMDAMQQQQMAAASKQSTEHRLNLTRHALAAIAEGEYGYCAKCEEPIGFGRLQARPEAAFCVSCASSRR